MRPGPAKRPGKGGIGQEVAINRDLDPAGGEGDPDLMRRQITKPRPAGRQGLQASG